MPRNERLATLAFIALAVAGCNGTNTSHAEPWNREPTRAPIASPSATNEAPSPTGENDAQQSNRMNDMKIRLVLDDAVLTATLTDSATARDFASLLPLTLTLSDDAKTEKVSDLPRKLSTEGAPEGIDPDVGDITYYAPWGNLAIFYRDFGYAKGLVELGHVDSGIADLANHEGEFSVRFERAE